MSFGISAKTILTPTGEVNVKSIPLITSENGFITGHTVIEKLEKIEVNNDYQLRNGEILVAGDESFKGLADSQYIDINLTLPFVSGVVRKPTLLTSSTVMTIVNPTENSMFFDKTSSLVVDIFSSNTLEESESIPGLTRSTKTLLHYLNHSFMRAGYPEICTYAEVKEVKIGGMQEDKRYCRSIEIISPPPA